MTTPDATERPPARLRRQRELVERLRRQLAFEALVLERMEGKAGATSRESGPRSIAEVARTARRRQLAPDG